MLDVVTEVEGQRRMPFVSLWPRVIDDLRHKDRARQ